ncbi:MHS family proline/betaine transporter-like MFS transporter [Paraburkholderia sp. WC7.3g]|uniref:MHS family MFS transporter n=1 Tax=Paraburkholderia podalyriae TaxID=1938811 RepID=A0ABR7PI24_9BURK|nr:MULTISPECIES: MFS transporter [Paraburkholderia]MBB5406362.1 MHS family proline/betaine transporter-like MFS transporter [Paraburkholderia sp. HC6.4b]MBB5448760.1 MHS family proline/betaine transporter-like MFS transporter [Paraburkholderia sp. Kb1A]MBC8745967.1 MHS family MFS transporter [Paraburkholderia podalyriae]
MKRQSLRVLGAASIGNFGELYDFAIFGFSVPILARYFFPGTDRTAALLSTFAVYAVAFFARPIGGILFGYVADRLGRVKVLTFTVWLMAGSTMMIGLLPTYQSLGLAAPVLLVVFRIVQGLAIGGETSASNSYVIESAPDDRRGAWIGLTTLFSFMPNAFVAVLLFALQSAIGEAAYSDGIWRIPFLLGGLVGVVGFWLRSSLDDPEEFKQASQKARFDNPLVAATRSGLKCMLHVVLVMPVLAVGAYVLLGFMYTFLVREAHLRPTVALLCNAAAIMASAICLYLSGRWSDRVGRKTVLTIGAACVAITAYPAVLLSTSGSTLGTLIGQIVLGITVGIYGGAAFTTMTELFPTSFRTTGHAISYQLSVAVFGGTAPFIAAWLISVSGYSTAVGVYLAIIGTAGLIAVQFIPETRGVSLRTSVTASLVASSPRA